MALFPLVPPSPGALPVARKLHTEHQVSFWDAMLLAACIDAGVTTVYSEDLPGSPLPNLRIVNPFASPAGAAFG
jgi:predicted nucleic acid-binding protein